MDPDLQQQYVSMVNYTVGDNNDQAQAVLSNILAAKMASRLRDYNAQLMTLNRAAVDTAVVAVDNSTNTSTD
jgi:hypothetical protein